MLSSVYKLIILATMISSCRPFLPSFSHSILRTSVRSATTSVDNAVEGEASAMPERLMRQGTDLEFTSGSLNQIAASLDLYTSHLVSRNSSPSSLEKISDLNTSRKSLQTSRDENLGIAKKLSGEIGKIMKSGGDEAKVKEIKAKVEEAKQTAEKYSTELNEIETSLKNLISALPNLLDDSVPTGPDESSNELISSWGDVSTLPKKLNWPENFKPRWHDDVAKGLNGWLSPEAVKMSGTRFSSLSSSVALLERALSNFFLDTLTDSGYTEVSVPAIVSASSLENTVNSRNSKKTSSA